MFSLTDRTLRSARNRATGSCVYYTFVCPCKPVAANPSGFSLSSPLCFTSLLIAPHQSLLSALLPPVVYCLTAAIAQDKQAVSRLSVLHTIPFSPEVSFLSFSFAAGHCVCVCVCVCLFVCFLKVLSLNNCRLCSRFFFRFSFVIQGVLVLLSYGVVCRVHAFLDYCRSALCMAS